LVEIACEVATSCEELSMVEPAAAEAGSQGGELEPALADTLEQAVRARWVRAGGGREPGQRGCFDLGVKAVGCEAWTVASQSRGQAAVDVFTVAGDTGDHASIALLAAEYSAEEAVGRASGVSAWHEQADLDERGLVQREEAFPSPDHLLDACVVPPPLVEPVAVENVPNGCRAPSVSAGRGNALNGEGPGDDGGGEPDEVVVDYPADD
jgi:hypothetical protein